MPAPRTPNFPTNPIEAHQTYERTGPEVIRLQEEQRAIRALTQALKTADSDLDILEVAFTDEIRKDPKDLVKLTELELKIDPLKREIAKMARELQALGKLAEVESELEIYKQELAAADKIMDSELGNEKDVPEQILSADYALERVIGARDIAIAGARADYSMDGVEAFDGCLVENLKVVEAFLDNDTLREGRGGKVDMSKFPRIDTATVKKMVAVFEKFPADPAIDAYRNELNTALTGYTAALAEYDGLAAKNDVAGARRASARLLAQVAELKKLPRVDKEWISDFRDGYHKAEERINKIHAPAIQAAEAALFKTIPTTKDREDLVNARTEESVAPQPPAQPPAPPAEHPIFKALETDAEQQKQFAEILKGLNVPLTRSDLAREYKAVFDEVSKHKITVDKRVRTKKEAKPEVDSWIAWKQGVAYKLDAELTDQESQSTETRLGRIHTNTPDKRLRALAEAVDPTKELDESKPELYKVLGKYIDALTKVVEAGTDDTKADAAMTTALAILDPLRQQFKELLTGEIQARQAAAGIANPSLARLSAREYGQFFADVIPDTTPKPGPTPTPPTGPTPPDPRLKAEASVATFVTSMERAATLGIELKKLGDAREKILATAQEGAAAVREEEAVTQKAKDQKEKVSHINTEINRLKAEAVPLRKKLVEKWTTEHTKALKEKEGVYKKKEKELEELTQRITELEKPEKTKALDNEIQKTEELLAKLYAKDTSFYKDEDPIQLAAINRLEKTYRIGVIGYTAGEVIHSVFTEGKEAPLHDEHSGGERWIPPEIKEMSRDLFNNPSSTIEQRILGAYDDMARKSGYLRQASAWFVQYPVQEPGVAGGIASSIAKSVFGKDVTFGGNGAELAHTNRILLMHGETVRRELTGLRDELDRKLQDLGDKANKAHKAGKALEYQLYDQQIAPLTTTKVLFDQQLARLQNTLNNPRTTVAEFYQACFYSLQAALHGATAEATPEGAEQYSKEGFAILNQSLQRLGQVPNRATVDALIGKVQSDKIDRDQYRNLLVNIAQDIESHKETNLPKKRQDRQDIANTISTEKAKIDPTQKAVEAAKADLDATNAEKLADSTDLIAFEAALLQVLADADPNGDIGKLPLMEAAVPKAKARVEAAKKAFKEAMIALNKAYSDWLGKRILLTPTSDQATESERGMISAVVTKDKEVFQFYESHGAPTTGVKADFDRWLTNLKDEQKREIARAIAPELYPAPPTT